MKHALAYIDDLKKSNKGALAYTSDIRDSMGEVLKELIPLLMCIQENQRKIITMLTPVFGSVSGRSPINGPSPQQE